jgi:heat shock protein HslJ
MNKKSISTDENSEMGINDISTLHDIWALTAMQKKAYSQEQFAQHPVLEIYVTEKRVSGTDGCNRIGGSILTLTNSEIQFGPLFGTKMACQKMEASHQYNTLMSEVRTYKKIALRLYFYDIKGNELFEFKKVD